MEEVVASELLFQKAISEADKQSREKLAKMFGMTIIPRVNSNAPLLKSLQSVQPGQPAQKKLQGTLDRYMLDSMLIDASKAASAKALKAAKTADAKAADAKAADATPKKSSRAKKTADVNV